MIFRPSEVRPRKYAHALPRRQFNQGPIRGYPSQQATRRFPAYAAALLAITYAAITRGILVPAMFHLRAAGNDVAALEQIFGVVLRWWGVNDVLHVLTFALTLWALAEVLSEPSQPRPSEKTAAMEVL